MRMLFKQRAFSWFDSYDIYDEMGETLFTVKGQLSWGHRLHICDVNGNHIGTVQEKVMTLLPKFELYLGEQYIVQIKKEFTLFRDAFTLDVNDWYVQGDIWGWEYNVVDGYGVQVMRASKEIFRWTDTYSIDVTRPEDGLLSLMIVLAIDAVQCTNN